MNLPPPWVTRRSLKDGGYWFLIQVAVGLLPLWGTALLLSLVGRPYGLYELLKNGEFVLYAASFVAGGLYSVRHDIFPARNVLLLSLVVILVVASLVFSCISIISIGENPGWLRVDGKVLTWISVFIFIISTLICLSITIAEAGNAGGSIPDKFRKNRQALEAGLDKLIQQGASHD
jgi:hypothetical protein